MYICTMKRFYLILFSMLLLGVAVRAESGSPVVVVKADRTVIYPQRMELTGEESLMDILQMVPELLIAGYEDVIENYNLRIDNCPVNGDSRLVINQIKAKDIAVIQVCDNTGVAKGTIGMGRVLDINMTMPERWSGFVEGQGDFGKNAAGIGTVNALYGGKNTDLYANASYRHQDGDREYLTLHMTNRFDDRNKLLTYFTQQYLDAPAGTSRKVMGRARYFHTFNDMGTELLVVGGYQYASDPVVCSKLPLYNVELNTPLFTERLSLMAGVEGNYLMTSQRGVDRNWDVFNNDVYVQLSYTLPKWRLTAGSRVMFYDYKLYGRQNDGESRKKYSDVRNNTNACVVYVPDDRNQIQLGYYHKFYNPSYESFFMNSATLSDEGWGITEERLNERDINQLKLAYAYSRRCLTVQTEVSYYAVEGSENYTGLGASAYWRAKALSLAGGANLYTAKSRTYATFRFAPSVCLPHDWRIAMQVVYYTKSSPIREATGVPVYGCLSVNKQIGRHWSFGIDWHDMFDAFCSEAVVNRHAATVKLQYRF